LLPPVGWVDVHPEITPPSNFHQLRDTTTVSAYVADEESATDNPMGLGVSYDLGGASLKGGIARTSTGQSRADMGVSFSF